MRHFSTIVFVLALSLAAEAMSVQLTVTHPPTCGQANGAISAMGNGGVAPYTYSWTGPNGFTSTEQYIQGLEPGLYEVIATDVESTTASAQVTLVDLPSYVIPAYSLLPPYCPLDFPFGRFHSEVFYVQYGYIPNGPFTVNGYACQESLGENTFPLMLPEGQPYAYTITDGEGCSGTIQGVANYEVEWPITQVQDVVPSCSGGASGGFTLWVGAEGHAQVLEYLLKDGNGNVVPIAPALSLPGGSYFGAEPTTVQYAGLAAGDYTFYLRVSYWAAFAPTECTMPLAVSVPNDPTCGSVSGRVFADYDENCVQNGEPGLPGMILQFDPGPYFATTNSQGYYAAGLPLGAYAITQLTGDFAQHCPAPPANVEITAAPVVQDLADTALLANDVALGMASGAARPGAQLRYAIDLDQLTGATSGNAHLVMNVDAVLSFVSANPTPTTVAGTTITWDLGALSNFGHRDVSVVMQVPPDVGLVGTVLSADATLTTTNTDGDLSNNSASTAVTVTAALDPNDKQVLTSSRYSATQYFIGTDEWLDYTIRFQNTGTDTAFLVVVRDTLGAELDPASIVWGAGSHAYSRNLTGSGVLTFTFPNILLPDSNVNEPGSHGFVSFRIRPRQPVIPGTVISNAADIFFDINPPVHTNDAQLTAEMSTSIAATDAAGFFARMQGDQLAIFTNGPRLTVKVDFVTVEGKRIRAVGSRVIDAGGNLVPIGDLPPGYYNAWIQDERGGVVVVPFIR